MERFISVALVNTLMFSKSKAKVCFDGLKLLMRVIQSQKLQLYPDEWLTFILGAHVSFSNVQSKINNLVSESHDK